MAQTLKKRLQCRKPGFDPWVGKIPWRRGWLPTPVFLPGESHGQRSLVGYSPWGRKESDMTERLDRERVRNGNEILPRCAPILFVLERVCLGPRGRASFWSMKKDSPGVGWDLWWCLPCPRHRLTQAKRHLGEAFCPGVRSASSGPLAA